MSFDPATNRQNGLSYDANGNSGTGTYDVENRVIADGAGAYVYDHAGKRVKTTKTNAYTGRLEEEYSFYGIGGQKLVTLACVELEEGSGWECSSRQYNVYFGGKLVKSKGVVVVTDRLGSVRANSNGERMTYYPYGEEKTSTADGREKFGTYTRDNATTDYADQRYYAVGMGRFNTADPMKASAGPADPGSWNRYSYVQGDPVNFHDPSGLLQAAPDVIEGGDCVHLYVDGISYGCVGGGGGAVQAAEVAAVLSAWACGRPGLSPCLSPLATLPGVGAMATPILRPPDMLRRSD